MAAGETTTTRTPWGYTCIVSAGTAATQTLTIPHGTMVGIKGVYLAGAASTDQFILREAGADNTGGSIIFKATCSASYQVPVFINLFNTRIDGLCWETTGTSTTGVMSIYTF